MTHPSVHALQNPAKIAYRMAHTDDAMTYGDLDKRSNRGAHLFRSLGIKAGDHIALLMENCLSFMEICWAAQRAGLYYTPISCHLTQDEVGHILRDCAAKLFITSPKYRPLVEPLHANLPGVLFFTLGNATNDFRSWDGEAALQPSTAIADEVAGYDMPYSSGTTGQPKGIKRPFEGNPITVANRFLKKLSETVYMMGADTIYLSPAPLYHAAPLRFNMMTIVLGGTSVIMERFDAEKYLEAVDKYKATHSQLVPTMFVRMLKIPKEIRDRHDVSSLQIAIHAAAPCPVDIKLKMIEWWGPILVEFYAGSEGNGICVSTSQEWSTHPGTVGKAMVGVVKIVDDDGCELPPGQIGQIYFAEGPQFVYHNDPEKTKNAYNDRGWSTLGDIGYLDKDGFLYLTDRLSYMIISGGVNIYPQETEDVLIGHPMVADVAVFGVPHGEMGEEVKAVVQLVDPSRASAELSAELIQYCRQHLSPIKCPRSIDFELMLPRTPAGKLVKRDLRDRYWLKAATSSDEPR
ncbi:acyl-CoA synthetase [Bradyrhizobium sp. WSM2254]|uniref:acyl-CoA synthetase n=1 Tax=Bradyrhizobium sp. WSM2254 TaxID=1188263 RepID=UPI0004023AB3|nr:acyl-CoA synthetase [Bradyrhizobium sp. WSM2254]